MKKSKTIAMAASVLLISSCVGLSVSAATSGSGSCKKTTTSYTDVLTSQDYYKTASLSIGYYYRNNNKADMLCTYGYGDGGTKYARIVYNDSECKQNSETDSATVQLSITETTGNTINYYGWQQVSPSQPTGELNYTLSLTT